jgi:hypothetical protein
MQRYQMWDFLAMIGRRFSVDVFEQLGLRMMIQSSLNETNAWEKKECPLTAPLIMALVLGINLDRHLAIVDVFKSIMGGLRSKRARLDLEPVTEQALYHARARLGVEAVKRLFEKTAERIERRPSFHGLHVWAADGFRADVADTKKNDAFFQRTRGSHGESGFPSIKAVTLVSVETREVRAAEFGHCYMAEQPSVHKFLDLLGKEDLLILDRAFPSFELFSKTKEAGPNLLARISSIWKPRKIKQLGVGDWLVEIRARLPVEAGARRQKNQTHKWVYMPARMIEYTFESTGEKIRLLTDLLDSAQYPALELALLYHERWEAEIVFDELKTHLQSTAQGVARTIFRSQTPNGVLQEAYGMLALYNLVRSLMAKAAARTKISPDEISFVGTLNVIRQAIPRLAFAPKKLQARIHRQLIDDIAQDRIDRPRRKRLCARVIKKRQSPYPRKRAKDGERYFDYAAEIVLVDSDSIPWAA